MAETLLRSMRVSPTSPRVNVAEKIAPLRKAVKASFLMDLCGPVDHEKRRVAVNAYKEAKQVEHTVTEQLKGASLDKHSQSNDGCDAAFSANPCGAELVQTAEPTDRPVGCLKGRAVDKKARGSVFTDLMNEIVEYRRADAKTEQFNALHDRFLMYCDLYETDFISLARAAVYQLDAAGASFIAPEMPVCSVLGHVCGIADFVLVGEDGNYCVLEVKTTEHSIKPALSTMAQGVLYSLCLFEMLKLSYIPDVYVQVVNMAYGAVELHKIDVKSAVIRTQEIAPLLGLQVFYTKCTQQLALKANEDDGEESEDEFHDALEGLANLSLAPARAAPAPSTSSAGKMLDECMRVILQGIPTYNSGMAQSILRENTSIMAVPVCSEMLDSLKGKAVKNLASCIKARFRLIGLIDALEHQRIDFSSMSRFNTSLQATQLSKIAGCEWVADSKQVNDKPWTPKVAERFIEEVFRRRFPEVSSLNVFRE